MDLLVNIYTSAKSSFEKALFQPHVPMLMINVLLHEEGGRNRCSIKKTIVGKRLLGEKTYKGQRMRNWSIVRASKCSSLQEMKDGTVSFWEKTICQSLQNSTTVIFPLTKLVHRRNNFFQVPLLPFI